MMYELTVVASQLIVAFCRLHCRVSVYMRVYERERENREEEWICLAKHRDEMIINGERRKGEGEISSYSGCNVSPFRVANKWEYNNISNSRVRDEN